MKTLTAFGDTLEAEKIVKTETSILGYVQGKEVFSFQGIRDFTKFTLSDGEEWDEAELQVTEQLDERQTETEGAVLGLMNLMLGGGF